MVLVTCKLVCVDPARAAEMWPHVSAMLAEAFDYGRGDDTIEDVEQDVMAAKALLWIAWDEKTAKILAACTTKIIKTSREKMLVIQSCAGRDMLKWRGFITDLEAFGVAEGCDKIRVSGRHGWRMILRDYTQPWITIEKALKK